MEKSNTTQNHEKTDAFSKMGQQLDEVQKTAGKLDISVAEARILLSARTKQYINSQYENFNDLILEAARLSERLTEKMRRLVLEVTFDTRKYEAYKEDLIGIHGIEVNCQEGVMTIALPFLVPHRKSDYTDYIYKPLYLALKHWRTRQEDNEGEVPKYECCTVCFLHVYDSGLPLARVRDHDNLEEKHILDVVGTFFLKTDSGLYLNSYHTTMLGKEDRTYLVIMENEKFPSWLWDNMQNRAVCSG
ncbi:hypothetical protein I6E91_18750 [Enterocloster clostridioformis]|uniref:DUF6100 family protein n=1 Tax=Enterocloster TaxID=2719313 RepID=UPI001F4400C7|nr:DUF6100 family protein [Enterocloster clostridioformis]MCF2704094.1 hypothetical protein [Enterocloster clostridioformis]